MNRAYIGLSMDQQIRLIIVHQEIHQEIHQEMNGHREINREMKGREGLKKYRKIELI